MSRHDEMKERVERGTGDNFINWYNVQQKSQMKYVGKPGQAPDLIYSDGKNTIILEVTTAWYGQEHADFTMRHIRNVPNTADSFTFFGNMESALAENINATIADKCLKDYGENCSLVVRIGSDALTTPWEMNEEVIPRITIPKKNPFASIYVMDRQGTQICKVA